ncbi:MAG: class I SAM-dependent methyltransferase [Flavobacterium sp.]|nr:class I SAM-dependent methyltransferase [Flavobacterium sp.]
MTWEETIIEIRKKPEFKDLVAQAYFEENLVLNVERFRKSLEYQETLKLINTLFPNIKPKIIDIGAGNGISSIAFALDGFEVLSVEPDPSETVGAGAIRILKSHYKLENLEVFQGFGEQIDAQSQQFDLVHVRQALHHANILEDFCKEIARLLKPNGFFMAIREHVLAKEEDLDTFLDIHPLHNMYGGECAYTIERYTCAIKDAGLNIYSILKHYDSPINYFPLNKEYIFQLGYDLMLNKRLNFKGNRFIKPFFKFLMNIIKPTEEKVIKILNQKSYYPGIMYSFISQKL